MPTEIRERDEGDVEDDNRPQLQYPDSPRPPQYGVPIQNEGEMKSTEEPVLVTSNCTNEEY